MLRKLAGAIDRLSDAVGRSVAWATLVMVLTTAVLVVLRDVFQLGWIWLQEVSVYLHALVFLLGAAYTLKSDQHVRVDLFYREFSEARKKWVNTLGTFLFLLPTVVFIFWSSWNYVLSSWGGRESSHEAGGLIYPFPSLLKTSILIACGLLALQGISLVIRAWYEEEQLNDGHAPKGQL